jgi:predicted dinucleotide-binding enzyme
MTTISIIGSGNMATAIGTRAAKHGHTIELMSRNTAKAQALAGRIGNGAIFRGVLADDKPLDVFFAGDSAEAKARVAAFLESLDMRALDAGGLEMAHVLEWAGILLVGLARNGAGFDIALGAEVP